MWRISQVDRATRMLTRIDGCRQSKLGNIIRIIIESGFLYTSLVLMTFATEVADRNAIYGVADVVRRGKPSKAIYTLTSERKT